MQLPAKGRNVRSGLPTGCYRSYPCYPIATPDPLVRSVPHSLPILPFFSRTAFGCPSNQPPHFGPTVLRPPSAKPPSVHLPPAPTSQIPPRPLLALLRPNPVPGRQRNLHHHQALHLQSFKHHLMEKLPLRPTETEVLQPVHRLPNALPGCPSSLPILRTHPVRLRMFRHFPTTVEVNRKSNHGRIHFQTTSTWTPKKAFT